MAIDISSYFKTLKAYSESMTQSSYSTPKGDLLNLCRQSNLGTVSMRPICDELGIPMKTLDRVFEVWENEPVFNADGTPELNDDGSQRMKYSYMIVPDPLNFRSNRLKLNPEQINILNTCIDKLNTYMDLVDNEAIDPETVATKLNAKFRKEIVLFWAKVISLIDKSGKELINDGIVRLIRHNSASFVSNYIQCINTRDTLLKSSAWQQDFFGNTPGKYKSITSITTDLNAPGTVGYSVNVQFMELSDYELTDEDVSTCKDLNEQLCNITTFDSEVYIKLTERLDKYINEAKVKMANKLGVSQMSAPSYVSINAGDIPPAPPVADPVAQQVNYVPQQQYMGTTAAPANMNPWSDMNLTTEGSGGLAMSQQQPQAQTQAQPQSIPTPAFQMPDLANL